jgi:hypothetical protein
MGLGCPQKRRSTHSAAGPPPRIIRKSLPLRSKRPLVVEPSLAVASRANTVVHMAGRTTFAAFHPLVCRQGASNDARAFRPERKRPPALLVELFKLPGDRSASRANANRAVASGGAEYCVALHVGPKVRPPRVHSSPDRRQSFLTPIKPVRLGRLVQFADAAARGAQIALS